MFLSWMFFLFFLSAPVVAPTPLTWTMYYSLPYLVSLQCWPIPNTVSLILLKQRLGKWSSLSNPPRWQKPCLKFSNMETTLNYHIWNKGDGGGEEKEEGEMKASKGYAEREGARERRRGLGESSGRLTFLKHYSKCFINPFNGHKIPMRKEVLSSLFL